MAKLYANTVSGTATNCGLVVPLIFVALMFSVWQNGSECPGQEPFPTHFTSPRTFEERVKEWDTLDDLFTNLSDEAVFSQWAQNRAIGRIVDITRCTLSSLDFDTRNVEQAEVELYAKSTKAKWQGWWESSGKKLRLSWLNESRIHQAGWEFAMAELQGHSSSIPDPLGPVWLPKSWQLELLFNNGDYGAMTHHCWLLKRDETHASLFRWEGRRIGIGRPMGTWEYSIAKYSDLTTDEAERFLAALTYVCEYRLHAYQQPDRRRGEWQSDSLPPMLDESGERIFSWYYYAGGSMRLTCDEAGPVWQSFGYGFVDNLTLLPARRYPYDEQEFDVGIGRALLLAAFGDESNRWQTVYKPDGKTIDMIRGTTSGDQFRFPIDRFADKDELVNPERSDNPQLETSKKVNWLEAGKLVNPMATPETKPGDTFQVAFEGLVYVWRVATFEYSNGSYSNFSLVRDSIRDNQPSKPSHR